MGALRLFLAVSVVVGHTSPLFGFHMLVGSTAVKVFFAVSGFYMALVLSDRYAGRPGLFYSNRALRLFPTYLLALVVTVAAVLATGEPSPMVTEVAARLRGAPGQMGGLEFAAAAVANLTMLGADLLWIIPGGPNAPHWGGALVIPPAWSLGSELCFYMLAPWLATQRTWRIVALALASFAFHQWLDARQPWSSYFIFPANLFFFLAGMLLFRFSRTRAFEVLNSWRVPGVGLQLGLVGGAGAVALLMGREFVPGFRNYSWMHYAVAIPAIPFLFHNAKGRGWDRWIGELSYPVYILHRAGLIVAAAMVGRGPMWGWATLALVLPAAVAVQAWVETPLDRWRAARAARARSADAAQPEPLAVSG